MPDLLALLNDRKVDAISRVSASYTLSKLADRSLAAQLLSLLLDDQFEDIVRWRITDTLATVADASLMPALLAKLSDSQASLSVIISAALVLRKLGHAPAIDILLAQLANHALLDDTKDVIIWDLISIDEPFMVEKLLSLLADPQIHQSTRGEIALALGRRGDTSIIAQLRRLRAGQGTDMYMYQCITAALSMLGDAAAEAELAEILSQVDIAWPVKEYAAEALDVSTRLKLLATPGTNSSLRWRIAEEFDKEEFDKLDGVERLRVIPELCKLLLERRTHLVVRQRIARTLGALVDDKETVRLLAPLVLDKTGIGDVMHSALWAMSRRAGVRVIWAGRLREKVQVVSE